MKKAMILCTILACVGILFAGCKSENTDAVSEGDPNLVSDWSPDHGRGNEVEEPVQEEKDYSEFVFADVRYTRATQADTEYITFRGDGSFSYYCACGEPVNDSDLTETYTYDDVTKKITLDCDEPTADMVTEIVIKECSAEHIILDFDGEIREFVKDTETEE